MPVHGVRELGSTLPAGLAAVNLDDLTSGAMEIESADILQLMFEVDDRSLLGLIPPALRKTIPPFATFVFWRWGTPRTSDEFTLAQVRVMTRAGFRSRGLLLASYCSGPADTRAALQRGWGFDARDASVKLRRYHDRVVGEVALEGNTILRAELEDPTHASPDDVEYAANLNIAQLQPSRETTLVQVEPEYRVDAAVRGRPIVRAFEQEAWAAQGLVVTNPVLALYFHCALRLPPVRYVIDPDKPLEEGTQALAQQVAGATA